MNDTDLTSITFFYPSNRVGGVQVLFIKLAIELSKYANLLVSVVDFPGGFLESHLKPYDKVTILPYNNGSAQINFKTLVITPLSNLADIKFLVKGDLRNMSFLFWCLQPYNLQYALYYNGRKFLGRKERIKQLVAELSDRGYIIYMDEANLRAVEKELETILKPKYIPIPLEIHEKKPSKEKAKYGNLNIGWLGRISFDKISAIIKIVDEIKSSVEKENIVFHVIGNGEKMDELKLYLKQSGINYVLAGVLIDEALNDYIEKNIDLAVSMGTSCLEFGVRKVPVFIVDHSFKPFPAHVRYNWLFETQNYTLGSHVNITNNRRHTFEDLLEQLKNDHDLGEKCYAYVLKYHSLNDITSKLLKHVKTLPLFDHLKFKEIQDRLNPPIYSGLYSLYRRIRKF